MNFGHCHHCEHFPRDIHGDVACGFPGDGVSIDAHVKAEMCPAGKFGTKEWPDGWIAPLAGLTFKGGPILAVERAVPRDRWPLLARIVARFAIATDHGLGDTCQRGAAMVGGEKFRRAMEWLGINCGCTNRKCWLNQRYPLNRRL